MVKRSEAFHSMLLVLARTRLPDTSVLGSFHFCHVSRRCTNSQSLTSMGCDTLGKECYYAQKPTARRWRRASRRLVDTRENRLREKGAKLCWLLVVTVYIVLSCIVDYFICEVVGRKLTIRASEITPSAVTWANKYQLRDLKPK